MNEVLLVADITDEESGGFDFEAASLEVGALLPLPPTITTTRIFRSSFGGDDDAARGAVLAGINRGPLFVNYIGHGSMDLWRGDLLTSQYADTLANGLRLPFVVSMTCLNGLFNDPYAESLAGVLLKNADGGAVAVWASSGLTEPDGQLVLNEELMRLFFNAQGLTGLTIGEAAARAKAAVTDMDIRRTWILFGDPTTKLK